MVAMDVLKFTWPLILVSWNCAATKLQDCAKVHNVSCNNGTTTFELEPKIQKNHMDCEAGIYDKDGSFLCVLDTSTLLKHRNVTIDFCPSEFHPEMQCPNKMDGHLLCEVNMSTLLNMTNFCPSEFRLEMQCPNKMNDVVSCFKVVHNTSSDLRALQTSNGEFVNDTSFDPPTLQTSDGVSKLWLLILIPVAVAVIAAAIVIWKMTRQGGENQSVSFSSVKQVESV